MSIPFSIFHLDIDYYPCNARRHFFTILNETKEMFHENASLSIQALLRQYSDMLLRDCMEIQKFSKDVPSLHIYMVMFLAG